MREYSLPGGAVSGVVRIGDTVHRRPGPRAAFVHELLGFFLRAGWPGALRFLGFDPQGREVLSFIEGGAAPRGAGEAITSRAWRRQSRDPSTSAPPWVSF